MQFKAIVASAALAVVASAAPGNYYPQSSSYVDTCSEEYVSPAPATSYPAATSVYVSSAPAPVYTSYASAVSSYVSPAPAPVYSSYVSAVSSYVSPAPAPVYSSVPAPVYTSYASAVSSPYVAPSPYQPYPTGSPVVYPTGATGTAVVYPTGTGIVYPSATPSVPPYYSGAASTSFSFGAVAISALVAALLL